MQIYNIIANNEKFQIASSCTLEQLHYALLYVLDLDYSNDYSFIDRALSWREPETKNTPISFLGNEFSYRIADRDFQVAIISANISDTLHPTSGDALLTARLHQDFLLPIKCLPSDILAIKRKLADLLAIFPDKKIIKAGSCLYNYSHEDGAYCIDVFANLRDLKLCKDSREEGVFKKSLSLVYIPDEDYFDLSEFDFGTVYEIENIAKILPVVKAVLNLEEDLPGATTDELEQVMDYHPLPIDLKTANVNPGKLQITIETDEDHSRLNLVYENISDKKELEFHGFEQLCHKIQELSAAKIEQIGIVREIEVNDLNLYNILLPLSRFDISVNFNEFSLDDATSNPFESGTFNGAGAQELLSRLLNKYGYQGLIQKIMSCPNVNMMDLMSLATRFKSQGLDPDDKKTRELLATIYEAFKEDL
ncbi:MAG: hypothetical protein PHS94_04215 [Erysipelotrichaceae bacterium]|nr:hypothetical protein [Erysipelotrichaceae bacterium]